MDIDDEDEYEDVPINQEDCWEVISAYFEEKGLVRQQVRRLFPRAESEPVGILGGPCPHAARPARPAALTPAFVTLLAARLL